MDDISMISVVNDFADDYGTQGVLDELFGGATIGELVLDMWNAGLIPLDVMEKFLNDE